MLYNLKPTTTLLPALPVNFHLTFRAVDDIEFLAALNNLPKDEIRRRLANDNTAYVAFYKRNPAAFGWSAAGKAFIGELNHEMVLPIGHKYLWNFRTVEEFRGKGIYPQLLQYIIRKESDSTECFWILHSPENTSSEKGIIKAGFKWISKVSIKDLNRVIVSPAAQEESTILNNLGFDSSFEEQASCWMCSSPFLSHKKTQCCCSSRNAICNQRQFITG